MGGKAFSHLPTPLLTPRIPPSTYHSLLSKYISLLSTLYQQVASPTPAPDKSSHGDIDILVSTPRHSPAPTRSQLCTLLAATTSISSPPLLTFAVPYPADDENTNTNNTNNQTPAPPPPTAAHVQLDVHVCPPTTFTWTLFHNSHGDAWNILGTSLRPFGLTATHKGLHARIPCIEAYDRARSLVFLTDDPAATLGFLGLDAGPYGAGEFASEAALFGYLAGGRFMRRGAYERVGLRANDRKRVGKREMYRRFVEEWVLGWEGGAEEEEEGVGLTREEVLEEALERFGKRGEYVERVERWEAERRRLGEKREGREERKAQALADEEYADAWVRFIK